MLNQYHIVLRGVEDGKDVEKVRKICSVKDAIDPFVDEDGYYALAKDPDLKIIVSNTTEAGICYNGGDKMEDFEGIFIATTNLASNLDPAFERRLLYKIEFKQPGEEVRKKIWKTMIPELEDVYIDILASKYNFSGGQIENVATKRDLDYIIEGTEPSILKIQEYCETEMIKSKNPMNKIGFRTEENYKLMIDLPGVAKEDISLDFNDEYLTVFVKHEENSDESIRYIRKERSNYY